MEEYRRKFERAQKTIASLERERLKCEARLSAVDLSWNLVRSYGDGGALLFVSSADFLLLLA